MQLVCSLFHQKESKKAMNGHLTVNMEPGKTSRYTVTISDADAADKKKHSVSSLFLKRGRITHKSTCCFSWNVLYVLFGSAFGHDVWRKRGKYFERRHFDRSKGGISAFVFVFCIRIICPTILSSIQAGEMHVAGNLITIYHTGTHKKHPSN